MTNNLVTEDFLILANPDRLTSISPLIKSAEFSSRPTTKKKKGSRRFPFQKHRAHRAHDNGPPSPSSVWEGSESEMEKRKKPPRHHTVRPSSPPPPPSPKQPTMNIIPSPSPYPSSPQSILTPPSNISTPPPTPEKQEEKGPTEEIEEIKVEVEIETCVKRENIEQEQEQESPNEEITTENVNPLTISDSTNLTGLLRSRLSKRSITPPKQSNSSSSFNDCVQTPNLTFSTHKLEPLSTNHKKENLIFPNYSTRLSYPVSESGEPKLSAEPPTRTVPLPSPYPSSSHSHHTYAQSHLDFQPRTRTVFPSFPQYSNRSIPDYRSHISGLDNHFIHTNLPNTQPHDPVSPQSNTVADSSSEFYSRKSPSVSSHNLLQPNIRTVNRSHSLGSHVHSLGSHFHVPSEYQTRSPSVATTAPLSFQSQSQSSSSSPDLAKLIQDAVKKATSNMEQKLETMQKALNDQQQESAQREAEKEEERKKKERMTWDERLEKRNNEDTNARLAELVRCGGRFTEDFKVRDASKRERQLEMVKMDRKLVIDHNLESCKNSILTGVSILSMGLVRFGMPEAKEWAKSIEQMIKEHKMDFLLLRMYKTNKPMMERFSNPTTALVLMVIAPLVVQMVQRMGTNAAGNIFQTFMNPGAPQQAPAPAAPPAPSPAPTTPASTPASTSSDPDLQQTAPLQRTSARTTPSFDLGQHVDGLSAMVDMKTNSDRRELARQRSLNRFNN